MTKAPASPQRKADFREEAREIQSWSLNKGQAIAAALERAYQRGWKEAYEGLPDEPDSSEAMPWLQIPPRPRAALKRIVLYGLGHYPRAYSAPPQAVSVREASEHLELARFSGVSGLPQSWAIYRRSRGEEDWRMEGQFGATTVAVLIRLGLLFSKTEPRPGRPGEVVERAFASEYGIETWLSEAWRLHSDNQPWTTMR